jgi:hypothetical protein
MQVTTRYQRRRAFQELRAARMRSFAFEPVVTARGFAGTGVAMTSYSSPTSLSSRIPSLPRGWNRLT